MDENRNSTLNPAETIPGRNRKKPYVIGLTGNIATGKTTVMSMLRHLGARIVDADQLAHEALAPNTSAWQRVVDTFGRGILDDKGAIVRGKLAEIVFNDAKALAALEAIVHPIVLVRVRQIMDTADEPVLVVEAIKLIESGLLEQCDTLWVVTCRRQQQMQRLMEQRFLREDQARIRVAAQPPQAEKIFHADVVIDNSGTLEKTWEQVRQHWQKVAASVGETAPALSMRRATREDVPALARFLASMDWRGKPPNEESARARVMGRAHWLLFRSNRVVGMASWEAINLVSCLEEIVVGSEPDGDDLLGRLALAVEGEAKTLQCEVVIATFPPGANTQWDRVYENIGYRPAFVDRLPKPWRDVVEEIAPESREVTVKSQR